MKLRSRAVEPAMVATEVSAPASRTFILPPEVLREIASHIDSASAASLALAHRSLTAAGQRALWRDVSLSSQSSLGERPLIHPQADTEELSLFARRYGSRAEGERREALQQKIRMMLNAGDEEKWEWVERLELVGSQPRNWMEVLLSLVSPHLLELNIRGIKENQFQGMWRLEGEDRIERQMAGSGLSFPQLSRVHLGPGSIEDGDWLYGLLAWAPNLVHLDADLERYGRPHPEDVGRVTYPRLEATRLRYLRGAIRLNNFDNIHALGPIPTIINHSPLLQQLSLVVDSDRSDILDSLHRDCSKLEHLRDLQWRGDRNTFKSLCSKARAGFRALERLVIPALYEKDVVCLLYRQYTDVQNGPRLNLPNLASLFLDRSQFAPRPPKWYIGARMPCSAFTSNLLRHVRQCPKLNKIYDINDAAVLANPAIFDHLDSLAARMDHMAHIRTYYRGNAQLHHANISQAFGSSKIPDRATTVAGDLVSLILPAAGMAWQDCTEYEGKVVPLSILMRISDTYSVDDLFSGRNVPLNDEGWKILTEWKVEADRADVGGNAAVHFFDWTRAR